MKAHTIGVGKAALLALLICLGSRPAMATAYYISPGGKDTNSGMSQTAPWKTLARASSMSFSAGDSILLKGGRSFDGELTLGANSGGTEANPITIGSYGGGRATIDAGSGTGISIYDTAGVTIGNLNIIGGWNETAQSGNAGDGISVYTDLNGDVRLTGITIENCDISGFWDCGIVVGSWPGDGSQSGFDDVAISNCQAHDNGGAGISTWGPTAYSSTTPYAHTNVTVSGCNAYRNYGEKAHTSDNTGNGIVLGDVNTGTIEYCKAYDNGQYNFGPNGGPVGIWAWDSNNITIQYCEAYDNSSATADGDGFDFDGGVTNSVMQYNYSLNNRGAGYLIWEYGDPRVSNGNNTIRYNISQNDAGDNWYASITEGSTCNANSIYGNTLYNSRSSLLRLDTATDNQVYNNIFQGHGGFPLIEVTSTATTTMLGNDYYAAGEPFVIDWGGAVYASCVSWQRATGQEMLNGASTGSHVKPDLANPGGGGTIADLQDLDGLSAYRLRAGSPVSAAGVDLYALGIAPGTSDFFGDPLPAGAGFSIGADQLALPAAD